MELATAGLAAAAGPVLNRIKSLIKQGFLDEAAELLRRTKTKLDENPLEIDDFLDESFPGIERTRVDSLDAMDHAQGDRPVSGHRFGVAPVDPGTLNRLDSEIRTLGGKLNRNADALLDAESLRTGSYVAAAFDPETGTVLIRKNASLMQLRHEMLHLRQWHSVGGNAQAYRGMGRYRRESEVFRELWKERHLYSDEELQSSIAYMRKLKSRYLNGKID